MYWRTVEHTCARFDRCFTDHGAMQEIWCPPQDLTADYSHLSIAGHRKFAAAGLGGAAGRDPGPSVTAAQLPSPVWQTASTLLPSGSRTKAP